MARYLVVANLTSESPSLRDEAAEIVRRDPDAVFDVVVPMTGMPPLLALVSDVNGHELRRERAERARRRLLSVGAAEVDLRFALLEPLDEIGQMTAEHDYAAIIVSTLPHRLSRWLRTDLPGRIRRRHPTLEVRVVTAPSDLYQDPASGRGASSSTR